MNGGCRLGCLRKVWPAFPALLQGRFNGRKQDLVSFTQCDSPEWLLLPCSAGCLPSSLWSDYLSSHRKTPPPTPSSITPFPMAQGSIKHKTPAKCLRPPTVKKTNQMKMKKLTSLIYCNFFQYWGGTFWFSYARQSIYPPAIGLKNLFVFQTGSRRSSLYRLG